MEAGKGWREEVVRKDDGRREKGVIGKRGGEGVIYAEGEK